jgi:DNA-directed RNA polymerase specialized sigma24 family protein|nr:MAG TPA: RNA polymerase sigma factor [Caudoviricetes sp.]
MTMNSKTAEVHRQLQNFRKNIERMLDAGDQYAEFKIKTTTAKGNQPRPEQGASSGFAQGPTPSEIEAQLERLYRKKIQAEENVNDVDRMLYGLSDEEVELLEMLYWDKLPVRVIADAMNITIPGVYWRRNQILDKMAKSL